jgi:hypothetical protein
MATKKTATQVSPEQQNLAAQKPALSIMQVGDWKDAKAFRMGCLCHHPDHDINVWIEVNPDSDIGDIDLSFYVDTEVPWWKEGFNRFKTAWTILTKGYMRMEHHFMLNKQGADNLIGAINASFESLKDYKK